MTNSLEVRVVCYGKNMETQFSFQIEDSTSESTISKAYDVIDAILKEENSRADKSRRERLKA